MIFGVIASFFFAALSLLLSKKIKLALVGTSITGLAIILGALTLNGRDVVQTDWYFGLD